MIASPRNTSLSQPKAQPAPQGHNPATPQPSKAKQLDMTTILVALIGALATVMAAFFASPIVESLSYDQPPPLSETEVIVHVADEAGAGVDGAKVSLFFESGQFNKWTYSNGSVQFLVPLPDGADELDVSMTVEHDEYQIYNRKVEIPQEKLVEIRLNKKNKHSAKVIMRVVDDQSGLPVAGQNILLLVQGDTYNQITDSNGIAEFVLPFPEGKIDAKISITPPDYEAQYQHVTLLPNKVQDLRLSGKETAHAADLPNENPLIATPTPVYVVVSTPEVVSVPTSPTPAAPVPAAPAAPASPTPAAPVTALGGVSTPLPEEAVVEDLSVQKNSNNDLLNNRPTSNRPANVVPTETNVTASSTPVPVMTKESATNTPTTTAIATKVPATSTPTATKESATNTATPIATATNVPATKTPTATSTKEIATNTPTATVIEPSATQTPVPTVTQVPPTETPSPTPTPISVTVTVTIAPTSDANEDQEQEYEAEVNIVAEEATAVPTEEVLVTIEPTAVPTEQVLVTIEPTAAPIATATPIIVAEQAEESAVTEVAEDGSQTEEQPMGKDETFVEEDETFVEEEEPFVEEDESEAILVLDP